MPPRGSSLWFLLLAFLGFQGAVFYQSLESTAFTDSSSVSRTPEWSVSHHSQDGASKPKHAVPAPQNESVQVSYAISVTNCSASLLEAAAVHGHSIDLAHSTSLFPQVQRHAIVHPSATDCSKTLEALGYGIWTRDTPVALDELNAAYRMEVQQNGCCGIAEFLKLYAYLLPGDVVFHLDTDVLVLKPPDDVIGALATNKQSFRDRVVTQRPNALQTTTMVDFMYCKDYYQGSYINWNPEKFAVQGGVLIVKPNATVFEELLTVIRRGDYTERTGWGDTGVGGYWGAPQIQGLLSYYYRDKPNAIELNRCIYDNMVDDPINQKKGAHYGQCTTGARLKHCQDCRQTPLEDIQLAHFTLCGKPWKCQRDIDRTPLCFQLHAQWYSVRRSLDRLWNRTLPTGEWWNSAVKSYCNNPAPDGYRVKRASYRTFFPEHQELLEFYGTYKPPKRPRKHGNTTT